MKLQEKRSMALFASIGLNLFLLGLLGAQLLNPASPIEDTSAEEVGESTNSVGAGLSPLKSEPSFSKFTGRKKPPQIRNRAPRSSGPEDLHLLREMVRIMGGRKDARVSEFWGENRVKIAGARREIQRSHRQIRDLLTKEPFKQDELQAAMIELRARSQMAQQRAQDAVVELAQLMTAEERQELRRRSRSRATEGANNNPADDSRRKKRPPGHTRSESLGRQP